MPERPLLTVVTTDSAPRVSSPLPSLDPAMAETTTPFAPRPKPLSVGHLLDGFGRVAIALVVAVVAAFALAPRLVKADLPVDAALLGTPARGVVKADRDYALVDEDATQEQRRLATLRSLGVWDLDDEHARRDSQVLQKALLRVAVALETLRKQHPEANRQDPPFGDKDGFAVASLDEVRAVVAGELASASLEAPQDPAWKALTRLVWQQPAALDLIIAVVAAEMPALVAATPPSQNDIIVRSLAENADEHVVNAAEVVTLEEARARLQKRLQNALSPAGSSLAQAQALATWLQAFIRPTLSWNAAETELRRRQRGESVPPVIVRARRGETVLRPGEIINARSQLLVQAMAVQQADELRLTATLGTFFFVALVVVVVYLFGARRVFQRRLRLRDLIFLGVMLSLSVGLMVTADATTPFFMQTFPGMHSSMIAFAIPVAFGPMCVRLTLPPDVALLFALVVAILGGVVVEPGMSWAVVVLLSSMSAVAFVMRGPRRLTVLLAGVLAGLVGAAAVSTLELFRGAFVGRDLAFLALATFTGGVASGVLALVVVPVVERAFGYVTDQRLYGLADLNHPLLKDMIVNAPGTWHHSVRAAVLAERAAQAIGANPLLARVMALYHDIGKISAPQSFRENQQHNGNPHDRISAEESVAVLRGHVEEGLRLASEHGLPRAVAVVIEEHHADMVMEGFLAKARAAAGDVAIDERNYRYLGRLPQTKESALVLLADQIEATARNLGDPTPQQLTDVVDHFVNRALTNDTLAACDLSLKELGRARAVLKEVLLGFARGGLGENPAAHRGSTGNDATSIRTYELKSAPTPAEKAQQ